MKKIVGAFLLLLAACSNGAGGGQDLQSEVLDETPTEEVVDHSPPAQPFVFEPTGDFIQGIMPIDIEALPSGNFVVATRDGQIIMLDHELQSMGHAQVPLTTFWDAGLVSVVYSSGKLFVSHVLPESACASPDAFCMGVVRYDLNETADNPLSNPFQVFNVSMVDRDGQHNGGGMIIDDDGKLILAVGDGFFAETEEEEQSHADLAQDDSSYLGKILKLDPDGVLVPEIISKGLRNPFTAAKVPGLGALIGDVGLETYEEINLYAFGGTSQNYGWPLEEGPTEESLFTQPILGFNHCDPTNQDQDPFGHGGEDVPQAKFHAGVVHECGSEIITAAGYYEGSGSDPYGDLLDRTAIYAAAYYGYVRGASIDENGMVSNDRHLAHFPGITAFTVGQDGYLYGVSIFASIQVLKLVPNIQ